MNMINLQEIIFGIGYKIKCTFALPLYQSKGVVYTEKQNVGQLIIDFSAKLKTRWSYLIVHELSELQEPGSPIFFVLSIFPNITSLLSSTPTCTLIYYNVGPLE